MVRVGRLELPASCSQSKRATNCATPGYEIFQLWSNMWSTPIFDQLPARGKVLSAQLSQVFPGFPRATARTWASRSQMCVGTFSRHFSALFGPFLCLGSSSLTLFCPACFKKPFRLLGFVWDWILCIKRCSARFEGGNGRPDHLSGETQELRRIKQRNTPRHDMACSEAGKCVFGPTTRS